MDLSPNDIRNYEFPSQMRGYDKEEVDCFLEQIAAALEETKQENLKLSMEVDSLMTQLTGLREFEDAIKSAAIDARRNADKTVAEAKEEAEKILSTAREEAEALVGSQEARIDEINRQLSSLDLAKKSFIQKLRGIIIEHSELVDGIAEADIKKTLAEDDIEVTDSSDVTRDKHEMLADEGEVVEEPIVTEEANAAEKIVATEASDEPSDSDTPPDAKKKPIDPELAAALESYQAQQAAKDSEAKAEDASSKSEAEATSKPAPRPGEIIETTARAEDIPPGFIARRDESSGNSATSDTDKVGVPTPKEILDDNAVDIDSPVLAKKGDEQIDPDGLADALDDVVAKFEETVEKAEKS